MTSHERRLNAAADLRAGEKNGMKEIIERIMTQHWDLAACPCWVCKTGRDAGCRPREEHLEWRKTYGFVDVADNPSNAS